MAMTLGLGDLATRIVRALGVRGRVPTVLDEVIVPVAVITDLTDPLFAQNPATFCATNGGTGGAATQALVSANCNVVNTQVIIDSITILNSQAVQDNFNVNLQRGTNTVGARVGAILNQPAPLAQAPLVTFVSSSGAPAGNAIAVIAVPATSQSAQFALGVILYPGDRLFVTSTVAAVTATMLVTWQGREFIRA